MTNKEFAQDPEFVKKCEKAGVQPTKRQASKYRNRIRRWKLLPK